MNRNCETPPARWRAVVLAASRGPDDPLARHYGVDNKCLLKIAGKPMLARVVETLVSYGRFADICVVMEDKAVMTKALGKTLAQKVNFLPSDKSAPASLRRALDSMAAPGPVLVTTADHVLLDHVMLDYFIEHSGKTNYDLTVGVARDETILQACPDASRTFLKFGRDKVSGCNLFAFKSDEARRALDVWQHVEQNRKKPVKLVKAFGLAPLIAYLTGTLTLEKAFRLASRRIRARVRPVVMPFANAAIDVDKPRDKELAEKILSARP